MRHSQVTRGPARAVFHAGGWAGPSRPQTRLLNLPAMAPAWQPPYPTVNIHGTCCPLGSARLSRHWSGSFRLGSSIIRREAFPA